MGSRLGTALLSEARIPAQPNCVIIREARETRLASCLNLLNFLTKRLQPGAKDYAPPFWLRLVASLCLLLVVGASSAQAAHMHGKLLPNQAAQAGAAADLSQVPGGEDGCPLCMAMHSALPSVMTLQPLQLVLVECPVAAAVEHARSAQWHFAMFSRPPPVLMFKNLLS